jgi:hypothetical protein
MRTRQCIVSEVHALTAAQIDLLTGQRNREGLPEKRHSGQNGPLEVIHGHRAPQQESLQLVATHEA